MESTEMTAESTEMSKYFGFSSKQNGILLAEYTEMSKHFGFSSKQLTFSLTPLGIWGKR